MKEIAAIRQFNRFYTRVLGLFQPKLMGSGQSLVEARILYEVWQQPGISSADITRLLDMDRGQLSRVISKLVKQGLLHKEEKHAGRRAIPLTLTAEGERLTKKLNAMSEQQMADLVQPLEPAARERLVSAMQDITATLSGDVRPRPHVTIRPARSGDMGWVIQRHCDLYGATHGFDEDFERYVLLGLAEFAQKENNRSRLWIAEQDGSRLGCIAVVEQEDNRAQLRWLLVEPQARGLGVGRKLVNTLLDFCREQDYESIFLWTIDSLPPARKLYQSVGFTLAESMDSTMGGEPCVEQKWVLSLKA
ncbi:bifunctional helix-turn-helix transcriptional regulator/GNAT family N-acetyltransferase [Salidesulfovibrio onnuriiensis]|uniref:bifunctional helix-turn-helix transcriptional regulator/GNAT family N-acetyltransferase n=1 Tax=Salidesulfovibrio onnuriiensis TaxID=2583823 RepID=UPI0011CA6BF6|nr:helix-turn-helix domain-containing GNAT family N-acetyltransferase [Salidesulfovibrio onnuriiensis]